MTFNKLIITMFKANIKKYLLYFLCNSFTVMILFTYMTLMTNKSFMDYDKISSVISSNLIAPSIVISVFSVFFIIYTQNSFIKFRKTEFGLFMVLGMTNNNIAGIMLVENCLIALASLAAGLIAGTLFSGIFYFIITRIIEVNGIIFSLSYRSYLYTILFFLAIYVIVISSNLIGLLKYDAGNLLKSSRRGDRNLLSGKIAGIISILAVLISAFDLMVNYKANQGAVLLRSTALFLIGMYMIISNSAWFLSMLLKPSPRKYYKNILFISNIKYSINQLKKIILVISLLIGITIFFTTIGLKILSDSMNFGIGHNPYDIAYVELFGKNMISEEKVNSIINTGETQLISHQSLELISMRRLTILSAKELNNVLETSISVPKGNFINLFQIVEKDGYRHDTTEMQKAVIATKSGNKVLTSQGSIKKMLFNNIPVLSDSRYIIVNDEDYMNIKAEVNPSQKGHIKLMNFEDWKRTGSIATKLERELEDYNRNNTKLYFSNINQDTAAFRPVSKIGEYMVQKQSGSFFLFLITFVGILFYISSGVILHFKLLTEFEGEKIKYKKLYKIGITTNEIEKIISKELGVLFFLPYILGIVFSMFYSYSLFSATMDINYITFLGYPFILGLLYLGLQSFYYIIYKKLYIKKLISCVFY